MKEPCENCKVDFEREELVLVEGKLYCCICSIGAVENLFNKIRSIEIARQKSGIRRESNGKETEVKRKI